MSQEFSSSQKSVGNKKKTRFSQYKEVYQYADDTDINMNDNSLLLDDTQFNQQQKRSQNIAYTSKPIISHLNYYSEQLAKIEQQLHDNSNRYQQHQQKCQVNPKTNEKIFKRFSINSLVQQNQTEKINNIDQEKYSSKKSEKNQELIDQKDNKDFKEISSNTNTNDQNSDMNNRIVEAIKANERQTLDVTSLLNQLQKYEKYNQRQTISEMDLQQFLKKNQNMEIQQLNQSAFSTPKNSIKFRRSTKQKFSLKKDPSDFELKFTVQKYYDNLKEKIQQIIDMTYKKSQRKRLVDEEIKGINRQISQKQKLKEQLSNESKKLKNLISKYQQSQTLIRYETNEKKIRKYEQQYNIQIKNFKTSEYHEFYIEFKMDDIYMKLKKDKIRQITEFKLMKAIISDNGDNGLFESNSIVKILKNIFNRSYKQLNYPLAIIQGITTQYQLLLALSKQIQYLMLVYPLNDLQLNSIMDKLSFKITLLPQLIFFIDIELLKLRGNFISVYNLTSRNYEQLGFSNIHSEKPLFNVIYQLIEKYI